MISHESSLVKNRIYYNKSKEEVEKWVKMLRIQSCNMSFDEKFKRGDQLGKGKFSTVFQC